MQENPRLRIVTGKGGVGKTLLATSLALAASRRGMRTLIAEVHAGDRVSSLLGVPPVGPDMREVLENLHVVDMNPWEAIHEYSLLTLKFETIYRAVFENRLVRHFVRLVPSLAEYVMLGKIWYHEQQVRSDGSPRFDLIIIDAPATGHAISMLRTPRAIENTVPAGPMRQYATIIRDMLVDPRRTRVHIVTTPEEMPVNEAKELEQASSDVLHMALGRTFINQRVDLLPAGVLDVLEPMASDAEHAPVLAALRAREARTRAGESHLQRLPSFMLADALTFPAVVDREIDVPALEPIIEIISEALAPAADGRWL